MTTARPAVVFLWKQFAPYHRDRCAAVAAAWGADCEVVGLEVAPRGGVYAWPPEEADDAAFTRITLFPESRVEEVGTAEMFRATWEALGRRRLRAAFLCHYEQPAVFLLACALRLRGVPVFVMFDSAFDDKPRRLGREALKRLALAPYQGALASGRRARDYLVFLGIPSKRVALGYDTLDVARVRREAAAAPTYVPQSQRPFVVVARFVAKKNLTTAIDAYARYRADAGAEGRPPRGLVLCGDGPLRAALAEQLHLLGVAGVDFRGFLPPAEVARTLAGALALLLPSVEEQWGLVVNEALALGVPVLASTRVGAADGLLRPGVSGFLADPHDAEGFARLMTLLDRDAGLRARLSQGARGDAAAGDVRHFVASAQQLLGGPS